MTDERPEVPSSGDSPRPRSSLRDEQKSFTRARLLETAIEVIGRRGYAAATVGEIAQAAHASRATFYLHFKSKEDLVAAMVAQNRPDVEAYYSRLDDVLEFGSRELFREWMGDALEWFHKHEAISRALEHFVLTTRGSGQLVKSPFTAHMPKYTSRHPGERAVEAELRVWLLVMLMSQINLGWRFAGSMPEVGDNLMIDVMTDIWMTALTSDPG